MSNTKTHRRLCAMLAQLTGAHATLDGSPADDTTDWDALALLAQAHHVLPVLGGAELGLPPDLAEAARTAAAANRHRNAAITRQVLDIGRSLNHIGVTPILLKGAAALFGGLYPRPCQRWMGDVDLLVPTHILQECEQALRAAGYRPCAEKRMNFDTVRTNHHHLWSLEHPDHPAPVELHFAVCVPLHEHLIPTIHALRESEPIHVDGVALRLLSPRLALLHNFVHNQLQDHGFSDGDIRLRRLLEFALLRRRHPEAQIWSWLHAHLDAAGHAAAFVNYVDLADELFLGRCPPRELRSLASHLAKARFWLFVDYPLMQQSWSAASNFARAARKRSLGVLFKKLSHSQWYARKWHSLRSGRRHF